MWAAGVERNWGGGARLWRSISLEESCYACSQHLDVSEQSGSYSQVCASVELIGVSLLPDRAGLELESPFLCDRPRNLQQFNNGCDVLTQLSEILEVQGWWVLWSCYGLIFKLMRQA